MQRIRKLYTKYHAILLTLCIFEITLILSNSALAWSKEISLGYAIPSKESDEMYDYSGAYLNGSFYAKQSADHSLLFTLNASAGYWLASSQTNNRLITVAFQPTIRVYFSHNMMYHARPCLFFGYGPAYLSDKTFGCHTQCEHFAFQGDLGAGIELGGNYRGIDLNIRLVHYSNASLFSPNQRWDFFVISIGKLF